MKLLLWKSRRHGNHYPLVLLLVMIFSASWFSPIVEMYKFEEQLVTSLAAAFDTFHATETTATRETTTSLSLAETTSTANTSSIRRWGCHRSETPTIFVHIGKSGGGHIRARFAAAALDYNRDNNWKFSQSDRHYYPLPDGEKAKFCNSKNRNHRFENSHWANRTYEGNLPCNATTPLGMALACPNAYKDRGHICRRCSPQGTTCHVVYAGHNHMGSEFHWLPAGYLQNWWIQEARETLLSPVQRSQHPKSLAALDQGFEALKPNGDQVWCPWKNVHRPLWEAGIVANHKSCGVPLATIIDKAFRKQYGSSDYSPWYASLPLHRVVLLRDPWTWIVSKFFWHKSNRYFFNRYGRRKEIDCDDLRRVDYPRSPKGGWATSYLLTYLSYLCGDDCESRLEAGLMTLEEAEHQAAGNLRNSFSVVGLLEESDTFMEMVSARISYIDMSLNPNVTGSRHSSKKTEESLECDRIFQDPDFRNQFREAVPLMVRMERLYQLAIEVNRVQQQELSECTSNILNDA